MIVEHDLTSSNFSSGECDALVHGMHQLIFFFASRGDACGSAVVFQSWMLSRVCAALCLNRKAQMQHINIAYNIYC